MLNIIDTIRLKLKVGQNSPTPAIASVLGQRGVNIMKFLQQFNTLVKGIEQGCDVVIVAHIYQNKSFKIIVKGRPASDLLKEAMQLSKGSAEPGKVFVGSLTLDQVREIAKLKMCNVHTRTLQGMVNMLLGTAYSMGIKVLVE